MNLNAGEKTWKWMSFVVFAALQRIVPGLKRTAMIDLCQVQLDVHQPDIAHAEGSSVFVETHPILGHQEVRPGQKRVALL